MIFKLSNAIHIIHLLFILSIYRLSSKKKNCSPSSLIFLINFGLGR